MAVGFVGGEGTETGGAIPVAVGSTALTVLAHEDELAEAGADCAVPAGVRRAAHALVQEDEVASVADAALSIPGRVCWAFPALPVAAKDGWRSAVAPTSIGVPD